MIGRTSRLKLTPSIGWSYSQGDNGVSKTSGVPRKTCAIYKRTNCVD